MDALYFTDGSMSACLLDELDATATHALFGDARALAAEEDDRRILDLRAHHRAGACWRCPGPSVPMQRPGLPVIRAGGLRHANAGALLDGAALTETDPASRVGFGEHVHR